MGQTNDVRVVLDVVVDDDVQSSGSETAFHPPLRGRRHRCRGWKGRGVHLSLDGSISGDPALRRKQAVSRYLHVAALSRSEPPGEIELSDSWLDVTSSLLHPAVRALSAFFGDLNGYRGS